MWTVETLNSVVDAEIAALPADLRARLVRLTTLIETVGLEKLPQDTVKHLNGKLWEIRVRAISGISRAIYVTASDRRDHPGLYQEDAEDAATRTRIGP